MTVVSIGVYTILFPMIVIITVAAFFIYKAIYDKHTNKVLESGETAKRKWIAPWGMALIVLGAQLLLAASVMLPISLFMIDPGTQETNFELSSENPVLFDISDGAMFLADEENYTEESTLTEDGIKIIIYHNKNAGDNNKFILIGEIEKESKEPAGVYISYENAGTNASCLCGMTENKDSSKLYFKCEVLKKPDTPAYMVVGIKNGQVTNMSGNKIDFDKDVRLEF